MYIFTVIKGVNFNREETERIHSKPEAEDFYKRWKDRIIRVQVMQYKDVTQEFKDAFPSP